MSGACCGSRPSDGYVDHEVVERAVRGQPVDLAPEEFSLVTYRLNAERKWGLTQIADWTNCSRSRVGAELARQRRAREGRTGTR